jgi:chromosome segregation ATPase
MEAKNKHIKTLERHLEKAQMVINDLVCEVYELESRLTLAAHEKQELQKLISESQQCYR